MSCLTVFTLFLESSAAPAKQNFISKGVEAITKLGSTVNIKDEDKQALNEGMKSTEDALPRTIKIVADAILEATGTEKLTLVDVRKKLQLIDFSARLIHKVIRTAIAYPNVIALKVVAEVIDAAVAVMEDSRDEFNEKLPPGEVKDGVDEGLETSIRNASNGSETLKTYYV